jgi:hypothetical protein
MAGRGLANPCQGLENARNDIDGTQVIGEFE